MSPQYIPLKAVHLALKMMAFHRVKRYAIANQGYCGLEQWVQAPFVR